MGSLMYVIEGADNGFTSIPRSIYWAIITLTTVGYGDIVPETNLGQALASVIMIIGYSIIAVPTGIVTSEIVYARNTRKEGCARTAVLMDMSATLNSASVAEQNCRFHI
jgi:voltage-gated potassium channel